MKLVHIKEPFWTAGKTYGWDCPHGIGIKRSIILANEVVQFWTDHEPYKGNIYQVTHDIALEFGRPNTRPDGTLLLVIPADKFIIVGEREKPEEKKEKTLEELLDEMEAASSREIILLTHIDPSANMMKLAGSIHLNIQELRSEVNRKKKKAA